jgi:hypothetical protein
MHQAMFPRTSKYLCAITINVVISILGVSQSALAGPFCPSGFAGLTTTKLREISVYQGVIDSTMSTLTQNRRIGRAFQNFVQRSMQYTQENGYAFSSKERLALASKGNVRPDFTESVVLTSGGADPHGSFVEVKAVESPLTLGYYSYQIQGHIDAVSTRPVAALGSGAPRVLFITTSNTVVPNETLSKATAKKVSIWQAIVCYKASGPAYVTVVSSAVVLNPSVYPSQVPLPGFQGQEGNIYYGTTPPAGYEDAEGGF